jgi:hypothetical protein
MLENLQEQRKKNFKTIKKNQNEKVNFNDACICYD